MGFSPGIFEGIEGDGLQAVRYHRKTIAALAAEGSFLLQPEAYNHRGHDPWNRGFAKQELLASLTPASLCDAVPKDSAS